MDRASGSGVFARDPDALLDLIELDLKDELLVQEENKAACDACIRFLNRQFDNWEDEVSQDDMCSQVQMTAYCRKKLTAGQYGTLEAIISAAKEKVHTFTAWRIEGTLREFPKFAPVNLWFNYPVHRVDDTGVLGDIQPDDMPSWQKKAFDKRTPEQKQKDRNADKMEKLRKAFEAGNTSGSNRVRLKDIAEYMSVGINTVKNYVDASLDFERENGTVVLVSGVKNDADS